MKTLTMTLRQPAQLSTSLRSDGLIDTASHVPGWVVRGALAGSWIRTFGQPERATERDIFERLFEGGVRFGPLYAEQPPPPLSVHRHKYAPTSECVAEYLDVAAAPDLSRTRECPKCEQEWVPLRPAESHDARHVRTSVAIDQERHTALPGKLFSRRRLRTTVPTRDDAGHMTGQTVASFSGEISGEDELVDALVALRQVRIGGRKTSHGAVTVEVAEGAIPRVWVRDDGVLVFVMSSPAIFVDTSGRPTNRPSDDELSTVLGCHAVVLKSWTRWDSVGGWHAASGLPKPTETVVTAGSTYAVQLADPSRANLAALMDRGLGLRRHEGFGHIGRYPESVATGRNSVTLADAADAGDVPAEVTEAASAPAHLEVAEVESPEPVGVPEVASPEMVGVSEASAAVVIITDEDLLPFVALRYDNGVIPAELSAAIRGAAQDESLASRATSMAKEYGGKLTGARDALKVERLLALPPDDVQAIVTRLEQG